MNFQIFMILYWQHHVLGHHQHPEVEYHPSVNTQLPTADERVLLEDMSGNLRHAILVRPPMPPEKKIIWSILFFSSGGLAGITIAILWMNIMCTLLELWVRPRTKVTTLFRPAVVKKVAHHCSKELKKET